MIYAHDFCFANSSPLLLSRCFACIPPQARRYASVYYYYLSLHWWYEVLAYNSLDIFLRRTLRHATASYAAAAQARIGAWFSYIDWCVINMICHFYLRYDITSRIFMLLLKLPLQNAFTLRSNGFITGLLITLFAFAALALKRDTFLKCAWHATRAKYRQSFHCHMRAGVSLRCRISRPHEEMADARVTRRSPCKKLTWRAQTTIRAVRLLTAASKGRKCSTIPRIYRYRFLVWYRLTAIFASFRGDSSASLPYRAAWPAFSIFLCSVIHLRLAQHWFRGYWWDLYRQRPRDIEIDGIHRILKILYF